MGNERQWGHLNEKERYKLTRYKAKYEGNFLLANQLNRYEIAQCILHNVRPHLHDTRLIRKHPEIWLIPTCKQLGETVQNSVLFRLRPVLCKRGLILTGHSELLKRNSRQNICKVHMKDRTFLLYWYFFQSFGIQINLVRKIPLVEIEKYVEFRRCIYFQIWRHWMLPPPICLGVKFLYFAAWWI